MTDTQQPEIGKRYITRCGEKTGNIYKAREHGTGYSAQRANDVVFEASIPGSHFIEFYRTDGTAISGNHHDLLLPVNEAYENVEDGHRRQVEYLQDQIDRLAALNAELVGALEDVLGSLEYEREFYERNGPQWTSPQGNEYESTSDVLHQNETRASILRAALARARGES